MEKSVYQRYCEVRDKLNYKDSDVSKGANITKSTFSDWKAGRYTPKQDKMQRIAEFLGVTTEYLMTGNESTKQSPSLTKKDQKEISAILSNTEQLLRQDGLMFDGNPASQEEINSIISAMKVGMELAKQKNKEKYTPKKYKKD